jgi:hypothetical protein
MSAGYSGTPLTKKLGLKDGMRALLIGVPAALPEISGFPGYASVEHALPSPVERVFDYAHVFETDRGRLQAMKSGIRASLKPDGMVWFSWPKKASKVKTDITEDVLRDIFLATGLVDVKVAAMDETWSGLKFMFRKELRAAL